VAADSPLGIDPTAVLAPFPHAFKKTQAAPRAKPRAKDGPRSEAKKESKGNQKKWSRST
jgi:hypothetical protein